MKHTPHTQPPHISRAKKSLRKDIRARRAALPPEQRTQRDHNIQHNLLTWLEVASEKNKKDKKDQNKTTWVTAFSPMPHEPGGTNLPEILLDSGYKLILPRVPQAPHKQLEWVPIQASAGAELHKEIRISDWGIREPIGKARNNFFDMSNIIIIPALAIDQRGIRLGQGGGFYDRVFEKTPSCVKICAVIDHDELYPQLPSAEHDSTVEAIVSEHTITYIPLP